MKFIPTSRALAISLGRYRDELHPILSRMAFERPGKTAVCSAMSQTGIRLPAKARLEIFILAK